MLVPASTETKQIVKRGGSDLSLCKDKDKFINSCLTAITNCN
jgi:hypothetical protein